jgi:hypothetical protein
MIITFDDDGFISEAINEVDALCDAARLKVVVDPVRMKEYETAEAQATAFKAQGYPTDVPAYVKSWQEAKGWTAQEACDDILAAAKRWQDAMGMLRDARLKTKEAIRNAPSKAMVDAIVSQFKSLLNERMQGVQ